MRYASQMGLRLLVYDRTCAGRSWRPGLSHAWRGGSWLYRGLGRFDGVMAASSWQQALGWLVQVQPERTISEVQFWGHGKWGCVRIGDDVLDGDALLASHPLQGELRAIRERMTSESLWWFRTCETFGAEAGQTFASAWSDFFGCASAGHTYIIAFYQSGLHRLFPGQQPHWPAEEGLAVGTAARPEQALWSHRKAPNTVTCLQGRIPRFMR